MRNILLEKYTVERRTRFHSFIDFLLFCYKCFTSITKLENQTIDSRVESKKYLFLFFKKIHLIANKYKKYLKFRYFKSIDNNENKKS